MKNEEFNSKNLNSKLRSASWFWCEKTPD